MNSSCRSSSSCCFFLTEPGSLMNVSLLFLSKKKKKNIIYRRVYALLNGTVRTLPLQVCSGLSSSLLNITFLKSGTKWCGEDRVINMEPNVPTLDTVLGHYSELCQRPWLEQPIASHKNTGLHYPEQINCSQCD